MYTTTKTLNDYEKQIRELLERLTEQDPRVRKIKLEIMNTNPELQELIAKQKEAIKQRDEIAHKLLEENDQLKELMSHDDIYSSYAMEERLEAIIFKLNGRKLHEDFKSRGHNIYRLNGFAFSTSSYVIKVDNEYEAYLQYGEKKPCGVLIEVKGIFPEHLIEKLALFDIKLKKRDWSYPSVAYIEYPHPKGEENCIEEICDEQFRILALLISKENESDELQGLTDEEWYYRIA